MVVTQGQRAKLTAVYENGVASISGVSGTVTSGVVSESEPLTADTTFTLTVTGSDKDSKPATATVAVRVVPAPLIASFTAAAPIVARGQTASLTATFSGGTGQVDQAVGAVESGVPKVSGVLTAATTFTLTVTNAAGDAVRGTTSVEVVELPRIADFSAAKTVMTKGASTTLTATFSAGDGVIDNGIGSTTSGSSSSTGPLNQTTTFTLTVTGRVGTPVKQSVTITVVDPPAIATFSASPSTLTAGTSTKLTASFSGGTGTIDQGVGAVSSPASQSVSVTTSTTFTLTVTNAAGDSVTSAATVDTVPAPVITSFTAAATDLEVGHAPSLTAVFSDGTATINNGVGAVVSGSIAVAPLLSTAGPVTYTLTVTNSLGTSVTATVTVTAWPSVSIAGFNTSSSTVTEGSTVTLTGAFVGSGNIDNGVGPVTSPLSKVVTVNSTTTYTLTVTNPAGGNASSSRTVTAVPPPVITSFTAAATNINTGTGPTLMAVFTGGTGSISTGVGSVTSGTPVTASVLNAPGSVGYTLTVTNAAGTTVTRTVFVSAWVAPSISVFTATPSHVTVGATSVLAATFVGTGTVTPFVGGVTSPFLGSVTLTANRSYTLTVTNPAGSTATASLNITTTPLPVITSFTGFLAPAGDAGSPVTVPMGSLIGLTPVFSDGVGVVKEGANTYAASSGANINLGPVNTDTSYRLSVTNDAGTVVNRDLALEVDHQMYVAGNGGGSGFVAVYKSHVKQPAPADKKIYVQSCGWPTGLAYEPSPAQGSPSFLWVACRPSGANVSQLAKIQNPHLVNNTVGSPATSALTPITGSNTGMTAPISVVLANNELVVLNAATLTTRATIQVFNKNAGGNVAPVRSILPPMTGDLTQLGMPSQIYAYQNELYVSTIPFNGFGVDGILVYPLNWTGTNVAPTRTLVQPAITNLRAVYVDADGLYVGTTSNLFKYAVNASGTTAPLVTGFGSGINGQLTRYNGTLYAAFRFGVLRANAVTLGDLAVVSNTLMDFDTPAATVIDPAH